MNVSKFAVVLIASVLLNCASPTDEEIRVITDLNHRYDEYEFAPGPRHLGTYLNVKLRHQEWDTTSLISTYDSSVGRYGNSKGIPWVYLAVYDKSNRYIFYNC